MDLGLPAARSKIRERISTRKAVKWGLLMLFAAAGVVAGYRYWRHSELYESTDNAYVGANRVDIAAQVSGPVVRLNVQENQPVRAGDILFEIDPVPYQLALAKARSQLELARQSVAQASAKVGEASAQVAQRRADLQNAEANYRRSQELVASKFLSNQAADNARNQAQTAAAALQAAQAALEEARSALGASGEQNATVQAAVAAVRQAELDLQRTKVASPTNGTIANLSLRPGMIVQPGAPLFVVISNQEYWVDANFKETQLKRIRPGEPATIEVDMYPDHPFNGVVESLSGGSGTAFSLLPPQNATGNWVKVTQRVPVRVRVLNPDPRYPLRIGTTATVTVAVEGSQPN